MAGRRRAASALLTLVSAVTLACDATDVVVLRLPAPTAGVAGGGVAGGGVGGVAGAIPNAGTAGGGMSGAAAGSGGDAGRGEGGSAGSSRGGDGGGEQAGSAGAAGMAGLAGFGGTSGHAGTGGSDLCRNNDDCPPSRVCAKIYCTDELGACEPEPLFCEATPDPVCGCNQVTYWNDCVRRSAGVPASTTGECRAGAASCDVAEDCGVADAVCARLRPRGSLDMCPPGPGTCWVLPKEQCDPGDPRRWVECVPPGVPLPTFPPPCIDTCTALMSGRTHIPARPDILPCP